ncbi:hypothetical protein GJAV_G00252310 [Gymnothorax javanicus]|nr:hypothetical protein GJAV_G00252310 [Gymnothorax javanicus]
MRVSPKPQMLSSLIWPGSSFVLIMGKGMGSLWGKELMWAGGVLCSSGRQLFTRAEDLSTLTIISALLTHFCLFTGFAGVDESMVVVLKFSKNRMAICGCSIAVMMSNDATVCGTKGTIRVPSHMWCPTRLEVNGQESQYPLPEPSMPLNFINSTGLRYEAEEVRHCLLKGLKESPLMSLEESVLLHEVMDEPRRQVGVVYPQDGE